MGLVFRVLTLFLRTAHKHSPVKRKLDFQDAEVVDDENSSVSSRMFYIFFLICGPLGWGLVAWDSAKLKSSDFDRKDESTKSTILKSSKSSKSKLSDARFSKDLQYRKLN